MFSRAVRSLLVLGFEISASEYAPDPEVLVCCPELYAARNQQPLSKGFIDPTLPPYRAAGDGVQDDATALQQAVNDARQVRMPVVLPAGRTFLLTKQLLMMIAYGPESKKEMDIGPGSQLIGSTAGRRPKLRLQDGSQIATADVGGGLRKPVFLYFVLNYDEKINPSMHYHALLRNIDVDVGDNPDVVAVSMRAAQQSSIQNVSISGRSFFAGVGGLPGSGGFVVSLEVVGGEYGIYQDFYRPVPVVASSTLKRQTTASLFLKRTRGPLVLSGAYLQPNSPAVAVLMQSFDEHGGLVLEDSMLQLVEGSTLAIDNARGGDLVLRNCYVKADMIARSRGKDAKEASYVTLKGASKFLRVKRYGITWTRSAIMEDGKEQEPGTPSVYPENGYSTKPGWEDPAALASMHDFQHWVPSVNVQEIVDVAADFGATPEWVNEEDDDGVAIQRALDAVVDPKSQHFGKAVLVPHGIFYIRHTLRVSSKVSLIGTGTMSSVIRMALPNFWEASKESPGMILLDKKAEGSVLSDFGVSGMFRGCLLDVRAPDVLIYGVDTDRPGKGWGVGKSLAVEHAPPPVRFSGHASGRIYGLAVHHFGGGARPGEVAVPALVIEGTWKPLHFYSLSIEHKYQADPQMLIDDSSRVYIHGLKWESPISGEPAGSHLWISGSRKVSVLGAAGNYNIETPHVRSVIQISKSSDVDLAGITSQPMKDRKRLEDKDLVLELNSGAEVKQDEQALLFSVADIRTTSISTTAAWTATTTAPVPAKTTTTTSTTGGAGGLPVWLLITVPLALLCLCGVFVAVCLMQQGAPKRTRGVARDLLVERGEAPMARAASPSLEMQVQPASHSTPVIMPVLIQSMTIPMVSSQPMPASMVSQPTAQRAAYTFPAQHQGGVQMQPSRSRLSYQPIPGVR